MSSLLNSFKLQVPNLQSRQSSNKRTPYDQARRKTDVKTTQKILCPKCKGIPKIKFISPKKTKRCLIEINCVCKYKNIFKLNEYMKILSSIQDRISYCEKNENHKQKKAIEYCSDCNLWLCEECLNVHDQTDRKHKIISSKKFGEISTSCKIHENKFLYFCRFCNMHLCKDCDINYHIGKQHLITNLKNECLQKSDVLNDIKNSRIYINEECLNLKTSYINKLLNYMGLIEEAYNEFQRRNLNIINLLKLIMNNYNEDTPNYYQMDNLSQNYHLKYERFDEKLLEEKSFDNIQRLLDYFNNSYFEIETFEVSMENFQEIKKISYHTKVITSLNVLSDGRIISSSMDKAIKVYNPVNYLVELNIIETDGNVIYLTPYGNEKIICALDNNSLKIYSITQNNYICKKCILFAHENLITKIINLAPKMFATSSQDYNIKIWQNMGNKEYKNILKLQFHCNAVNNIIILQQKNRLISSCSLESSIVVWDWNNGAITKVITEIDSTNSPNCLLEITSKNLVLVGGIRCITFLNLGNYLVENIVETNDLGGVYSFIMLRNLSILCGCQYGFISQYDIKEDKFFSVRKKIHEDYISFLVKLDDNSIASSSGENDICIKILKY